MRFAAESTTRHARELGWLLPAMVLAMVFAMGAHTVVFYGDEVDHAQLRAVKRSRVLPVMELGNASQEPCERARRGVTVRFEMSDYSLELRLPVIGARQMWNDAGVRWKSLWAERCNQSAA